MDSYCRYSQYVKEGLDQYLICSKSRTYCKYQRLCKTKKKVVHTDGYQKCLFLIAEEDNNMANKKNYSKKKEEIQKNREVLVEENVIEETNSAKEIVKEEPKKKEQAIVILATANFYVANKDGNNYKIVEKNNYKQGDIVEL